MSTHVRAAGASKRRTRSRRACVAVLTGVAAFAALQPGLTVGVETCLPGVRDLLYGTRLERIHQRLRAGTEQPAVVVMLGSSRTQYGFRTPKMGNAWAEGAGRPVAAFNFGVSGGGPLTELLTWRRLRRDGVRPALVLIEVLPPALGGQVPSIDFTEAHWPADRLAWQDLALVKRYAGAARAGLRRDWLAAAALPWYSHRFNLVSLVRGDLLPMAYRQDGAWRLDEAGGLVLTELADTAEQRSQARERARKEYATYLTDFHLGGPACEALRALLASCRQEGVPVALVVMPEGPEFRSWYAPETWPAIREWLDRISREHDAPLIDAREWLGEDDFHDSHHLTAAGAAKFTERLGREYVAPLLRGNRDAGP